MQNPGHSVVEQTLKGNFSAHLLQLDVSRSAGFLGLKNLIVVRPDVGVALCAGSLQAAVLIFGEIIAEKESQSFLRCLPFDGCIEKFTILATPVNSRCNLSELK